MSYLQWLKRYYFTYAFCLSFFLSNFATILKAVTLLCISDIFYYYP